MDINVCDCLNNSNFICISSICLFFVIRKFQRSTVTNGLPIDYVNVRLLIIIDISLLMRQISITTAN